MSPSARPPPIRRTPTEQAHIARKRHAASISGRAANGCAVCVPAHGIPASPPTAAAFAAPSQRSPHQIPEASRSGAGRAAAAAHSQSKDGGAPAGTFLPSESRRAGSRAPSPRTNLPKQRRIPMLLRETGLRGCAPAAGGAKARLSRHLSALLPAFPTRGEGKGGVKENRVVFLHMQSTPPRRQILAPCQNLPGLGTGSPGPAA